MCDCSEIEINTGSDGYNGYSPELAISEACDGKSVLQLISWINGTGEKPSFDGNIMTDAWLLANPIYLGENGFTDDCDEATDISGASGTNGTNGTNGSTGATGAAGEDGCDPDITITATVEGSDDTYDVTVTRVDDPLTPCTPEYNLEFPVEIFSDSAVIDAVDEAVASLLAPATALVTPTVGATPSTSYSIAFTSSGTLELDGNATDGSSISYYQIGNKMTINFNLALKMTSGSLTGIIIELKIPNGKTSNANTLRTYKEAAAVAYTGPSAVLADGNITSCVITTDSSISSSYLRLGLVHMQGSTDGTTIQKFPATSGTIYNFQGQITITVD